MPFGTNRSNFTSSTGGASVNSGAYTGTVGGFFAGTSGPTAVGLTYKLNTPSAIVGVGAFKQ